MISVRCGLTVDIGCAGQSNHHGGGGEILMELHREEGKVILCRVKVSARVTGSATVDEEAKRKRRGLLCVVTRVCSG